MCTETSYTLRCEHVVSRTLYCPDAPPLNPRSRKERKTCRRCIRNSVPWPPPPDFGAHIRCPLAKCPFEERGGYWNCCWCGKEWNEKGRNIGAITSAVRHARLPPNVNSTSSQLAAFTWAKAGGMCSRKLVGWTGERRHHTEVQHNTGASGLGPHQGETVDSNGDMQCYRPANELGREEVKASIHRAYHEGGQRHTGVQARSRVTREAEVHPGAAHPDDASPVTRFTGRSSRDIVSVLNDLDRFVVGDSGSSPEISFAEVRKTRTARKGHGRSSGLKRSSTYDFGGGFSAVVEEDDLAATTSSAAHSSRGSRKSTYDTSVDYLTKKAKASSSSKKKGYKHRSQY
ncbi:hypothetical protein CHU98_g3094 [Xylaria longipes]|nr:hypothetical protein CHU98_g3094 [Xylaria longipes]